MGQEKSTIEKPLEDICGLQIARVLPRSPAHTAGLVPFFDIITAVDNLPLVDSAGTMMQFKSLVAERENQYLCFKVYNLYQRAYRDVVCLPSKSWGGSGMLGCSIEWCCASECTERSWHIVDVLPGSPTALCGEIKAERDYIIGMQRPEEPVITLVKDEDEFHGRVDLWRSLQRVAIQRLQQHSTPAAAAGSTAADIGRLMFLIYDSAANEVKEVAVDLGPDVDGPLGMHLAAGLLHSLLVSAADDDETSGGGAEAKGRRGGLPVMTTFVTPCGAVERCVPAAQPQLQTPPPTVNNEQSSHVNSSRSLPSQPQPPVPPTMQTKSVLTAPHSLPQPPPELPGVVNSEARGKDVPLMKSTGKELNSAMYLAGRDEVWAKRAPPVSLPGRPTIPVISRSRPTTFASNDAEGAQYTTHMPPELATLQRESKPPPPPQQQQQEKLVKTGLPSSVPHAQSVLDGISSSNATSATNATVQPPSSFHKLPQPPYFPII